MKALLPSFFSFNQAQDLVRIGKNYDGGYLVSEKDIEKSDLLIGLGISDDWSFEEDFLSRKKVEILAYDGSVSQKYFVRQLIKSTIRLDKLKNFFYWFKKLLKYKIFFSQPNVNHIQKFVGLKSECGSYCTFLEILNETKNRNIFLKIDIEGSEYRLLNDIVENENRISGMVIELHDCDIHLREIKKFIKKFSLNLVHIHANNYAPIRLDNKLPLVLELTFSKYAKFTKSLTLPHKLDMPNNKNISEVKLTVID